MKLVVISYGDREKSIRPAQWFVECPFPKEAKPELLEKFKSVQLKIFVQLVSEPVEAKYDFEIDRDSENQRELHNTKLQQQQWEDYFKIIHYGQ
jgi:hypothetical protein